MSGRQSVQSAVEDPELFVRLILSKKSVYEQEPILATIKVYLRGGNLLGIHDLVMPGFDGFITQEIDLGNTQVELENFKGNNYQVATLKQVLLYPQRTGNLEITSGKFDFSVLVERPMPGIFRMMSGTQELIRSATTPAVTVKVKPLPMPRPASYMNAVASNLKLSSSLSKESLKANEAVTLKLTLSGTRQFEIYEKSRREVSRRF